MGDNRGRVGSSYVRDQTNRPLEKSTLFLFGLSREIRAEEGISGGQLLCFRVGVSESLTSSLGQARDNINRGLKGWDIQPYISFVKDKFPESKEYPGNYIVSPDQNAKKTPKGPTEPNFWQMCIPEQGIIPIEKPEFELLRFWYLDRAITQLVNKYTANYFKYHTAKYYNLQTPKNVPNGIILGVPFLIVNAVIQQAIEWALLCRVSFTLTGFKRCCISGPWGVRYFPKWRDGPVDYTLERVEVCPESEEDRFVKYETALLYPDDFTGPQANLPFLGEKFTKLRF